MHLLREMLSHPSRTMADSAHYVQKRPAATGGIIMLLLGLLVFAWLWPEIHRYMRIERM